jgi:hypothetical protein
MNFKIVMLGGIALLAANSAVAAVSADDAKKLGTSLTAIGADPGANKDGSIPAYAGGLTTAPAGFNKASGVRPDPFAGEKPVATITGANMDKYAEKLTEGTKELLKKYSDFKVEVYPTHRSVALPKSVLDNTIKNATRAKTSQGGRVLEGASGGFPFPIPANGFEAMWNHETRYEGVAYEAKYGSYNIDSSGHAVLATAGQAWQQFPYYIENKSADSSESDLFYQIKVAYSAPARRAGEALLVWDSINPVEKGRRAWQYLPGQRRVRLAPDIAYDTPNPGTAGTTTYDDAFMFNGAMDRYDFKLIGKKEIYVPYNDYKFVYAGNPDEVTTAKFANPNLVRWELHRVWVVEAYLLPGTRHIYAKRVFYLDEDSWIAVAADNYDAKGQLFRSGFAFMTPSYDAPAPFSDEGAFYDFVAGSWSLYTHIGTGGVHYTDPLPASELSSGSLAAGGIR